MQQQKGPLLIKVLVNQKLFPILANILTEVYSSAHSMTTRSNIFNSQMNICIASCSMSPGRLECLGYNGKQKKHLRDKMVCFLSHHEAVSN